MAEVNFQNVDRIFPGPVHAVVDLSLDVADGEFLVLVGPSGCGKSTILRMLAGLEPLTAGTISIDGRVVNRLPPKDRDIAMVFQHYALYPHMTVYKNMAFALRMRGTPAADIDRIVRRTAAQLGITELLDRRPRALSGGQQQRVALGRAIVRRPRCYLLDEPLSNLDAALRLQMRTEIKALHQRLATTTIYVTHDQEEAMTLGDRMVVLLEGRVQQIGPPLEVYHRPANRFVASFVGSPPMNLIAGRVEAQGERLWFDDGSGLRVALPPGCPASAEVVLGVRPQSLVPVEAPPPAADVHELTVVVCEPIGDRIDLQVRSSGGTPLMARVALPEPPEPGQTMRFIIDRRDLHLFEPGPRGARIGTER
jgi:multiple sugar transport system ATP-binding protein